MTEPIAEIDALRARLAEAEETLRAIGAGEVDALVIAGPDGDQVFTLAGADYPYRVLIEEMSEGAFTLTAEGLVYYANRRLAEMLKAPLEQVIGADFAGWVAPADRALFQALLQRQSARARHRMEVDLLAADGTAVPCYLSLNALAAPALEGCYCLVATDLTEQLRGAAIVAAERLARSILEQTAEAIVVCDNAGLVIRAGEVAHTLCESNPLGEPFERVFPLRRNDGAALSLATLVGAGERRRVEARLAVRGCVFDLLVSAGPLVGEQGERLGSVLTLTDITRRRRAEEALRESELRMKAIVDFMPVGVWFLNARGEVEFANAAGQRIWAGARYIGIEQFGEYKAWRADTGEPLGPHDWAAARAIERGETTLEERLEIECFDGTRKLILNSAVPIRGGDGRILGAVVVNQDITRRQADQDRRTEVRRGSDASPTGDSAIPVSV
jgi:PAS domain S-box-containing protein